MRDVQAKLFLAFHQFDRPALPLCVMASCFAFKFFF